MKNMGNVMTILCKKNNIKINKLKEIEILKEATSQNILNDVINDRNDSRMRMRPEGFSHTSDNFRDLLHFWNIFLI